MTFTLGTICGHTLFNKEYFFTAHFSPNLELLQTLENFSITRIRVNVNLGLRVNLWQKFILYCNFTVCILLFCTAWCYWNIAYSLAGNLEFHMWLFEGLFFFISFVSLKTWILRSIKLTICLTTMSIFLLNSFCVKFIDSKLVLLKTTYNPNLTK